MQAKKKTARRSLVVSAVALFLSVAMLIGTTFAWFTDSVTSGTNTIKAGNLDIEVSYKNDTTGDWTPMEDNRSLFSSNLWEPGHTEFVTLKIENKGTLALNYKVLVTPVSEKGGVNVDGESFKLSDYLVFGTTAPSNTETTYTRDSARAAANSNAVLLNNVASMTQTGTMNGKTDNVIDTQYVTLVVYMPETIGNKANYKTGTEPPTIDLGIKVLATQWTKENDSFGDNYDDGAVNDSFYTVGAYYDYYPQVRASKPVAETGDTIITAEGKLNINDADNIMLARVTVPEDATLEPDTESLTVTVVPKAPAQSTTDRPGLSAEIDDPNRETANFDIKVEGIDPDNTKNIKVEVFVGKGLSNVNVYHNGDLIDGTIYDPDDGIVTFNTKTFSDYTVAYDVAAAAIGSKTYGSLKNALNAAQNGETVTLLKDVNVTENIVINSSKNFALDLNGKTVTADLSSAEGANAAIDLENTSLEIKDSVGTGKIVSNEYGLGASKGGTITMTSGTIESEYAALSGNNTTGDMNFTVNGGTLTSKKSEAIYMPGQQTLKIIGGTINGGISARMGQIDISGGTINGMTANQTADSFEKYWNHSGSAWIGDAIYVWGGTYTSENKSYGNSCNINITGGTINGNAHNAIAVYDIANKYDQSITVKVLSNAVVNGTVVEDHTKDKNTKSVTTNWDITDLKVFKKFATQEQLDAALAAGDTVDVMLAAGTFKLKDGTAQNKNITISGTKDTVVTVVGDTGNQENYQNGATLAFEGVTIQGQTTGDFGGIAHVAKTTFVNCTFNGKLTLYGNATFINCTFTNKSDYAIWTWGAKNAEFVGCTFNSGGKALLLYGGAGSTETPTTNLTVTDCRFNDDDTLSIDKAAIEIGNDYGAVYNLTVRNITVDGFAINPAGISTGSNIWANKNSMDRNHLNVVINDLDVY